MSYRDAPLVPNEFFHVYNRGNSKQIIFKDNSDYLRFQHLLFIANGTNSFSFRSAKRQDIFDFDRGQTLVSVGAYCLMPNHFHILVSSQIENGIQKFMQKLSTGYSMYFNIKNERSGGLFEGKYKSKYINEDQYLKYLYSYIHLNPLSLLQPSWKEDGISDEMSAQEFLEQYKYSSLPDYLGSSRSEREILDREKFPEYFHSAADWVSEMSDWLAFGEVEE